MCARALNAIRSPDAHTIVIGLRRFVELETMAVGRFQVMATLQAARAFELGLPMDSALSWGLNRAIFYAAAKRGFKGATAPSSSKPHHTGSKTVSPEEYFLGDEKAYKTPGKGTLFSIGGKAQTKQDFERQISSRFGGGFESAWEDALDYVKQFDRKTLLSGEEFFASVYRPKRDEFAEKWTELAGTGTKSKGKN